MTIKGCWNGKVKANSVVPLRIPRTYDAKTHTETLMPMRTLRMRARIAHDAGTAKHATATKCLIAYTTQQYSLFGGGCT